MKVDLKVEIKRLEIEYKEVCNSFHECEKNIQQKSYFDEVITDNEFLKLKYLEDKKNILLSRLEELISMYNPIIDCNHILF